MRPTCNVVLSRLRSVQRLSYPLLDAETCARSFADVPAMPTPSDLTSPSLVNRGIKKGAGGRASVSSALDNNWLQICSLGPRRPRVLQISGITATVFGASGFLGRYIVQALARQGTQCILPHRCDDLDVQHLKPMGDLGQIVLLKDFNVFDDAQLERAVSRSNLVINLLGSDKETMNFTFEDVHIEAAKKVATAAANNGILERYLHVSCLAASPDHPSRRMRTKAEGEQVTKSLIPEATIFKAAQMTGVEDRLLNNYAQLAKKFPFIPLIDGGETKLQPTFVRDVADAIVGSLNSKDSVSNTYFLGGPEILTQKQLVQLTFETIRENYHGLYLPTRFAKLLARPREVLRKYAQIPINTIFTADYVDEMQRDALVPTTPGTLTYADLGIVPKKITTGIPIEHIRYYRVGGYDLGTTSEDVSTGGAGF